MTPTIPGAVPATTAAAPLSSRLYEGTRLAHESVERAAAFNRLIVVRIPTADAAAPPAERARRDRAALEYREIYRRFLVAAHGFEAAVDACIAASPARDAASRTGFEPETIDPTARIRADLQAVFGPGAAADLAAMDALPPSATLAEIAGTEYVRRGSRMGGAFIGAVVRHNLGLDENRGASFLGAYGRETRAVVTRFKAWADALPLTEAEAAAAIAAAAATFAAVERWHLRLEEAFAAG